ncbi:hypothetical protein [Sphingobacterium zhuxiongii]|nr:hypothetical protein [Sphingobacterium sp. dk4302]
MMKTNSSTDIQRSTKQGYYILDAGAKVLSKAIKATTYSVAIGVVLLIITLVLAIKIKILLFLLPISFYLISHLFLLNNHLKYVREQQIWYHPQTHEVVVEWLSGSQVRFNLQTDVQHIKTVQSVQKNNGVLFGYYELQLAKGSIYIPYLLEDSPLNNRFFSDLQNQVVEKPKTNLFPSI